MARPIDSTAAARRIARHLRGFALDIETLIRGLQNGGAAARATAKGGMHPGVGRHRRPLTAKDRARLKLQGQYLGLMRHLPKTHHSRVKELRAKRGYPAAIKLARRLSK
jgi:hypothetical protein